MAEIPVSSDRLDQISVRMRRIGGDILLALAVLLTADVVIVMLMRINAVVLKADYQNIFRHELILCAVILLFALDVRFRIFTWPKSRVLLVAGWVLRFAVVLLSALTLYFCGRVISGSLISTVGPAENAIVLGMALENGQPTRDLLARLDTAEDYLTEHPGARLILTGGNADASGRTEAVVMRDLLIERGVPEDRLRLEDKAATTKENFANTAGMLSEDEPVVLITSGYHMDRAVQTAKEAGFTDILRLPARSGLLSYGANMMWEVILDLKEFTE